MNNPSNRGWNRTIESRAQTPAKGTRRTVLRGMLAGLLVIVVMGILAWQMFDDPNPLDTKGPSSSRQINAAKPDNQKSNRHKSAKPSTMAIKQPDLPMPKISEQKIEKRKSIPAPQSLDELESAMTNKPPRKKATFQTGAEQLIALATPSAPGAPVPPLPQLTDEGVATDLEKAMRNVIKAEEGDSVIILEKKATVATAKEEFAQLREQEGWTFTQYLNALRDQANLDAEFLAEAHKMSETLYHDETISDEDYLKYRDQINEKLVERGLPEIE